MDDYMMKEAVFVFLHGPAAYPEGTWEPVLLEVLHEVGFKSCKLVHDPHLTLYETVSLSGSPEVYGSYEQPHRVPFGVYVLNGSEPDLRGDEDATRWLNDVALRISGLRVGCMVRKVRTPEEARAHFRETAMILNAGGTVDSHAEEREIIARDPKTNSEYEAMLQNPPDGFESFETFFARAQEKLNELIQASKPLEPILLTAEGDWFAQSASLGLHDKHLRDEMDLKNVSGIHRICGGAMRFIVTTETRITAVCDKCHLRITLPISTVSTLWQLRNRGEQIVL